MMDPDGKNFGKGPRELTGAVDLINHYKLLPVHDFFCKQALPLSISETRYLHNVMGDTDIRKGEGMELNQLVGSTTHLREMTTRIRPFDLDNLWQAFNLKETAPVELTSEEKGRPTISGKVKSEVKDKERKHKRHKEKDHEKDKEHKKHKHRHKDQNKDKDKDKDKGKKKDKSGNHGSGSSHSKKHDDKKRKHGGTEDLTNIHKHKKSKHKNSKVDEMGAIKVAG
uniref:TRAF3-interacting protein 1 n=1 Tax=Anthurium amnicola TaxID=1678845 RepID=A0A1D1XH46_9ARAE